MTELVGITAADVETLYCQTKIPFSQFEMDAVQRVALAAQRAMLSYLIDEMPGWGYKYLADKLGVE